MAEVPSHPAVSHPVKLRLRADVARYGRGFRGEVAAGNDWMATHLAVVFGVCWTIWVFFTVPVVAYFLPEAIQSKIFFFSSGWIQLFALPLMVYVGNKLQRSSDAQSDVMHQALTHIATVSDQNKELIDQNTDLTRQVHRLVSLMAAPATPAVDGRTEKGCDAMTDSAQGIDVSKYQSPLTAAALTGLDFAFAKATEGSDGTDPNFAANWPVIREAGKFRGAYHELRPGSRDAVAAQAAHFLATVSAAGLEPGDMLAASVSDYSGVTDADAKGFLDAAAEATGGRNPVICYSDLSVAAILLSCTGYPLWIAHPSGTAPASVTPWKAWRLWQWKETGLDQDAYNGTAADMAAWIATYAPPADWTFGAPRNLTATGGHTTVGLEWDPPAGAPEAPAEYLVYVYQGPVCNRTTLVASYPRPVTRDKKGVVQGERPAPAWEGHLLERGASYVAHVVASGPDGASRVRPYCYASANFTTG